MYKSFSQNIQGMRDRGHRPAISSRPHHRGRRKSPKVERIDTEVRTSHVQQWAVYIQDCRTIGREVFGVPPKILDELKRLRLA